MVKADALGDRWRQFPAEGGLFREDSHGTISGGLKSQAAVLPPSRHTSAVSETEDGASRRASREGGEGEDAGAPGCHTQPWPGAPASPFELQVRQNRDQLPGSHRTPLQGESRDGAPSSFRTR